MDRIKAIIFMVLGSWLFATVSLAQQKYVYLVTASDCIHKPEKRALTGFRVKGQKGIVTALHGVADSRTITVTSVSGKNLKDTKVAIKSVDIQHDLALLSSAELERMESDGLDVATNVDFASLGDLKVVGYPLGVFQMELTTPLTAGEFAPLGRLVDANTGILLGDRKSPDPTVNVIRLIGGLLPGHSGAPILDARNRVVAIGSGGMEESAATITWGIPYQSITWKSANSGLSLTNLKKLAVNMFAFDSKPEEAEENIEALNRKNIIGAFETHTPLGDGRMVFLESGRYEQYILGFHIGGGTFTVQGNLVIITNNVVTTIEIQDKDHFVFGKFFYERVE